MDLSLAILAWFRLDAVWDGAIVNFSKPAPFADEIDNFIGGYCDFATFAAALQEPLHRPLSAFALGVFERIRPLVFMRLLHRRASA